MSISRRPCAAASILSALALLLAGCGVGAGDPVDGVTLTVTTDGGRTVLVGDADPTTQGQDTVLRLLQRNARVETAFGGGFVSSIDGVAGGEGPDGRPVDWFFSVDGIVADRGAAAWRLGPGDRVWWDRRASTEVGSRMTAVVGSYPAPLAGGFDGRSDTVALRCVEPARSACRTVRDRLSVAGAKFATPADGAVAPTDARAPVQVLVGPVRGLGSIAGVEPEVRALRRGPRSSGVFVRARTDGLDLLDAAGDAVVGNGERRPAEAGTGFVAAMRLGDRAPVWVVGGVDAQGVRRAAKALDGRTLWARPAVVVDRGGARSLPLARR